ncbi:MAG: RpiB/LacA/LacB family sugar-phosphate isomerase [Patescibacteria group bacterium]
MKIFIGSDHAGFELKEHLKNYLSGLGLEVADKGAHTLNPEDDYPDFIVPVAKAVAENYDNKGIVIGGSGQGEAIAANKIAGIRAAVYYGGPMDIVTLSREHNDANILSLGARFLSKEEAEKAVRVWLGTPFSKDERHIRRIDKMNNLTR